uniref:Uncharacterized protein n=1 Tax=Aegilops tauschii subsp. strangulata TaxID=200361 RepID=A0A453AR42_AEGTS
VSSPRRSSALSPLTHSSKQTCMQPHTPPRTTEWESPPRISCPSLSTHHSAFPPRVGIYATPRRRFLSFLLLPPHLPRPVSPLLSLSLPGSFRADQSSHPSDQS